MAAPHNSAPADSLRDLAADIYVELVCRNVVVTETAAQINSNPDNLAQISFKLAEAFLRADSALKESGMPKNQDFDMKAAELPGFSHAKN